MDLKVVTLQFADRMILLSEVLSYFNHLYVKCDEINLVILCKFHDNELPIHIFRIDSDKLAYDIFYACFMDYNWYMGHFCIMLVHNVIFILLSRIVILSISFD